MNRTFGGATVSCVRGDITEQRVDAIVNAANARLAGGGGVDGAIHRAGGPSIMEECRTIGGCPTGQAVRTGAGDLPADHVIHAVGPIWRGGEHGEADLLASAYESSLATAADAGARTIAFPSISTGAYGYPTSDAAAIAMSTVAALAPTLGFDKVRFVLFSEADLQIYQQALGRVAASDAGGP
ncbi:MAG: O-acetyl-ADP-ribose deacetylase [Chloroflexota bacterium]|nr:O-acetyl-ADP-ribose deacetylase [Chloroflexota bacterium]